MTENTLASYEAPDWAGLTDQILCPLCDYNLRGLAEPRCPECGYHFAWPELLDPARRRHPYLFEHHPAHSTWAFLSTLIGGLRPWRFWRSIQPTQAISPRRLGLYMGLVMAAWALAISLVAFHATMNYSASSIADRASMAAWLATPGAASARDAKDIARRYGLVQRYLDLSYPAWWNPRSLFVGREMRIIPQMLSYLLAPALTFGCLLILRQSMRKHGVKKIHVWRCVVYCYDGAVLLAICVGAAFLYETIRQHHPNWLPVAVSSIGFGGRAWSTISFMLLHDGFWALLALSAIRLGFAYRLYLRFDHAFAAAVSAQLIVALVYVICMTRGWI